MRAPCKKKRQQRNRFSIRSFVTCLFVYLGVSVVLLGVIWDVFSGRRNPDLAVGRVPPDGLLAHPQFVVGSHSTGLGVVTLQGHKSVAKWLSYGNPKARGQKPYWRFPMPVPPKTLALIGSFPNLGLMRPFDEASNFFAHHAQTRTWPQR